MLAHSAEKKRRLVVPTTSKSLREVSKAHHQRAWLLRLRVLGNLFGLHYTKRCDWREAERLINNAADAGSPEVHFLHATFLLARIGWHRANGIVLADRAAALLQSAAQSGHWYSRMMVAHSDVNDERNGFLPELKQRADNDDALAAHVWLTLAGREGDQLWQPMRDLAAQLGHLEFVDLDGDDEQEGGAAGYLPMLLEKGATQIRFSGGRLREQLGRGIKLLERAAKFLPRASVTLAYWLAAFRLNIPRAFKLYEQAGALGDCDALSSAATLYRRQAHVPGYAEKAFERIKRGADFEDPALCHAAAESYAEGQGTAIDMKQAVSYYCKGARLGDGNCARRLVKLLKSARRACCQGTGVQRCAQCQQMQLALKEAKKSHPGVLLRDAPGTTLAMTTRGVWRR
jgi:hypothetical protein